MSKLPILLAALALSPGATFAEEAVEARYRPASGRLLLTVEQDIHVREMMSIASRELTFDLSLTPGPEVAAIEITVDRARASYTAHGMAERLGTRHITGRVVPLNIGQGGLRLEPPADHSGDALVPLDAMVEGGLAIGELLSDALPVLPAEGVGVGTTWTTEQDIRTLEGWAWVGGRMSSRHRVTAIDHRGGQTVVSVATEATADLAGVEGGRAYGGTLTRTLRWTFDTTEGLLLTLDLEQETDGDTVMPQGDLPVRQTTRLRLAPLT